MPYSIKESILARLNNRRVKNEFKGVHPFVHPDNADSEYVPLSKETIAKYGKARPRSEHILCYAPFKNMYFGIDGSATACCYNRTHSFGKFPEKSIHDMWFGAQADELRQHIKCNDLSKGCDGCQYLLNTGNYTGTQALYFDHYPVNKNRYPSIMQFELSNVCNLECAMCSGEFSSSIRKNRENLPEIKPVYDKDFTQQLKEFIPHLSDANFYGGEPFLIEQYYQIWDLMMELNPKIKVEIQTNATVLNKKVKTVLNKLNCNINISLDSLQHTRYESIRKNAKFEAVQKNIQYFANYCKERKTNFTISMCPMRNNCEELPAFVHYANSLNANIYFHTVWNPEHLAIWNLDASTLLSLSKVLHSEQLPRKTIQQKKNYRRYADYLNLLDEWHAKALAKEKEQAQLIKEKNRIKNERSLNLEAYSKRAELLAPLLKKQGVKETVMAELRTVILNDSLLSKDHIELTLSSCKQKLDWLSANLPEHIVPDDLFEAMLIQRPIENILNELKQENNAFLLEKAVIFANKYERLPLAVD